MFLKKTKYSKTLTSILGVKHPTNRKSGISSFESLVIDLTYRAICFFTSLEETPELEIQIFQNVFNFLQNLALFLKKLPPSGHVTDIKPLEK